MDIIYGVPTTFQDLNTALCGLKQGAFELAKDYYKQMAMLVVTLQECHKARFQEGELDCTAKNCFYSGLQQEHKALVAHLKDQDQMEPVEMLRALQEIEQSCYPTSISANPAPKPSHKYRPGHHQGHYQGYQKKTDGYAARPANLNTPKPPSPEVPLEVNTHLDSEIDYDDGYYFSVMNTVDAVDHLFNHCYNCTLEGHHWRKCTQKLKLELEAMLNWKGGTGAKGDCIPHLAGQAGVPLAQAQQ